MPTGIGSGIAGEVFTDEIGSGSRGGSTICPTRYSVEFDGSSQFGSEQDTKIDLGTDNFSFSFWFKTIGGGTKQGFHTTRLGSGANGLDIYLSAAGQLTADFDTISFVGGTVPSDNEWHHAVLSVDRSGDWKWYLDGVNINTVDHSAVTAPIENGGTSAWARTTNAPVDYFDGNLTELSIWGTALSSSEVLTIYNNMSGSQTCLTDLTFSSGNLIQNGSFNQIGPQLIDNPTFNAPTSPDLIVNGDFTDTGADVIYNGDFADTSIALGSIGSGWGSIQGTAAYTTFGGDTAVKLTRATTANIIRAKTVGGINPISTNTSYKLTYTVLENNGVTQFRIYASASILIPHDVSATPHVVYFTTTDTNAILQFINLTNNSDITFTDISVQELGEGWEIGSGSQGWSFDGEGATYIPGSGREILQEISTTSGSLYKIDFDITSISAGGFGVYVIESTNASTVDTYHTAVGPYERYFIANGGLAKIRIRSKGTSANGSVNNVTVQEVDWAFEGGWSLGSNKALATAAVGGDTLYQAGVFTLDKSYKTTFLSTLDSGNCFAEFGSDGFIGQLPSGTASNLFYYQTNEVGDSARIAFEVQSLMTGSISNVLTYQMDPNGYWNIPTANSTQLVLNPTFTNTGPEEVTNGDFSQTILGPEKVVDGDFPLPNTAWATGGGSEITIDGARINNTVTGANSYILQYLSGTPSGKQFVLSYDVITTNGTTLALEQTSALILNTSTTGTNRKLYFTWDRATNAVIIKRLTSGTDVTIDNVSVKEVLQEVSNGDFTDGVEQLTQPIDLTVDFVGINGGVIIDADSFSTDGTPSTEGIRNNAGTFDLVDGKSYKLVIAGTTTSSGFTIGNIQASGNEYGTGFGTHYFVATGTYSTTLWIRQRTAGTTDLTTFTIEELGADWGESGDSTISIGTHEGRTDVADINIGDTSTASRIYQSLTWTEGKSYKVTCEVYVVSGSFRIDVSNSLYASDIIQTSTTGSWQTLTGYMVALKDSTEQFWLRSSVEIAQFYVDSVSIQELGEGWQVSTVGGFSFNESGLSINSSEIDTSGGGTVFSACSQVGTIFDVGKNYKLVIEDLDITSGSIEFKFGLNHATTPARPILTSADNGTYVYYLTALVDSDSFTISSATGTVATLSSLSVKETGLDWISPDAGIVNTFSATGLTMTSVNGGTNNNRIRQASVTADDQAYKVDYTIVGSSLTAGNYLQFSNGATYVNMKTTVGSHILHFTRSGADDSVYLRLASNDGSTTDTVDIGSITIVEVQGWTLEDGKLVGDLPDLAKSATQGIGAIAGNSYKATMDVALAEEELITNGSFREVGTDLVLDGDFPLPNVNWIIAASTTINGGSATFGGLGTVADMLAGAFVVRVEADGGVVEAQSCLISDLTFLTENP